MRDDVVSFLDEEEDEEIKVTYTDTYVKPRDYSKFYTPAKEADYMVSLLELESHHTVLDPSAGTGNLIKAVHRKFINVIVDYYEINELVRSNTFLYNHHTVCRGDDFMEYSVPAYDRIIANPPFDEDKWFKHLRKMYDCLKSNGVLVCIIPRNFIDGDPKQNRIDYDNIFIPKMKQLGAIFYPIDNWAINSNGTKTDIGIIKIRK